MKIKYSKEDREDITKTSISEAFKEEDIKLNKKEMKKLVEEVSEALKDLFDHYEN